MTREELINKFPELFSLRENSRFPISYGFECGAGWDDIITRCTEDIAALDTSKTLKVFQIKEKFGGLRYYIEFTDHSSYEFVKAIYNRINQAEAEAWKTCENCGSTTEISTKSVNHWIRTLCTECRKLYEDKNKISQ